MAKIGVGMKKNHENVLDDSNVLDVNKIGGTLHNEMGKVRLKCLQALQTLYASEELKERLQPFTSTFMDQIIALALNKEYDVAVQAVGVAISILKYHRDILSDKNCELIYMLVYSSHRAVAQAAGEFLNKKLFVPDEEAVAGIRTKRGKKRLPNTCFIRDLALFFIESEVPEKCAYLVDSLIESNEMMKDWECMTDLLLEEPGPLEDAMNDSQETSLIEIMVCCIRQAATGELPVGRGPTCRQILSSKELKQVQDDKLRLTEHYIQTLPVLLDKYRADPEKLANLLAVPQYFVLNVYTTSRQEANLDLLLKKMNIIVKSLHNTEVLDTCSKMLKLLCVKGNAIYTRCCVARKTLLDMVVCQYKEAMDNWRSLILRAETPNEDDTFLVVYSLRKVSIFYHNHNLRHWAIWDSMYTDIVNAKDSQKGLPEEAVKYCISACFYGILWDLNSLKELFDKGSSGAKEVHQRKKRMQKFIKTMKQMLLGGPNQLFKEMAYTTICDLQHLVSVQLSKVNPNLAHLVYEANWPLANMLDDFIQEFVFIMEEDGEQDEHSKIEELHKRRKFLKAFCMLLMYNTMPTKMAARVFKHYIKYYNDYGDIIKVTLSQALEIDKTNCARTMVISLNMLFKDLQRDGCRINRQSEDFVSLKELAKRFALSFGLDAVKNQEAMTVLHKEGVLFSVNPLENMEDPTEPPPNLPFLEILTEFTNKLLKQKKRVVLNFLDRHLAAGMPSSQSEDWQPLLMYRNSLVHGEMDSITSKRAYQRKRKTTIEEEDPLLEEVEEPVSDPEFGAGSKKHRRRVSKPKQSKIPRRPKKPSLDRYAGDHYSESSGSKQFQAGPAQYDMQQSDIQQQALANYDPAPQYNQPLFPMHMMVSRSSSESSLV